ncbi:MAG: DUF3685 domain-containing protein [Synechococcus sp.]
MRAGLRLLLLAPAWQRQGLEAWFTARLEDLLVVGEPTQAPDLVLWVLRGDEDPDAVASDLALARERWGPVPVLLVLSLDPADQATAWLALPVEGLLHQPSAERMLEALEVLATGGRLVDLPAAAAAAAATPLEGGVAQSLLRSGLAEIAAERRRLQGWARRGSLGWLSRWLLEGRLRELAMAEQVLRLIWRVPVTPAATVVPSGLGTRPLPLAAAPLSYTLPDRRPLTLLAHLDERLREGCRDLDLGAGMAPLLALEALRPEQRTQLLQSLLHEFRLLVDRLATEAPTAVDDPWRLQQPRLRRRALQGLLGAYTRLPREGELVAPLELLQDDPLLAEEDPELPDLWPCLQALLSGRPLLLEGALVAPDEPIALLELQRQLSNWLVRNAEVIARRLIEAAAAWPELRRALLVEELLATRELERFRNRLNARDRWLALVERPRAIFESRRLLYAIENRRIAPQMQREIRDAELRRLGLWPQLVTLLLEVRDALAPQVALLLNRLGQLAVLLLTQVLGRAIGLIGRGILQGLGRGLQNATTPPERP